MSKEPMNDPLMNHAAVKLYRDTFLKCPSPGFRRDIAATVLDVELWRDIITNWRWYDHSKGKWRKRNVFDVKSMMDEYERREELKTVR